MQHLLRLIDANANRAREAMRVMEDAARFLLDDADLARRIKQMRHDLAAALSSLPNLPLYRDTQADVGTTITTDSERRRASQREVVTAAGKRLSEALRTIEEYLKTRDADAPNAAGRIESLRYQGYILESRLASRFHRVDPRDWRLCVLITAATCRRPSADVVRACLAAADDAPWRLCFQLREKQLDDGPLLTMAEQLVGLARANGAAVIVNDRPDIALLAEADGVHLGQTDLPPIAVRRLAGRSLLVGISTHNMTEASAAVAAEADYCGVGAMFRSTTKASVEPTGLDYLQQFRRTYPAMPHLAIGGIDEQNIQQVVAAGAHAVAVSRCLCDADDPETTARQLLAAFDAEQSNHEDTKTRSHNQKE